MRIKLVFILCCILMFYASANCQHAVSEYSLIKDSQKVFKTIDDILKMKRFKNKVVYVDFWGTGCGSCLKEFKYLPELKNKFQNDSLECLYLCTMSDSYREKLWKILIKKYKLTGTNILISKELFNLGFYTKYKDKIAPRNYLSVPAYLLVNKQGQIVDFNAPRPSSGNVLYDKIQKLLDDD